MKTNSCISKWFKYFDFILHMMVRNVKWIGILIFLRNKKIWKVMNFRMYLSTRNVELDLKENSIHKQLILDGVREKQATKIMREFIEPDDVILELGANIGYYVLIESYHLSEKGYIYAVEPGPENIDILKKNVQLNHIKNIEIFNMAMGSKKGICKLYISKAPNFHSLINISGVHKPKRYVKIRTETVDNFLKNRKPITFLRMDIEGYEVEVVRGMKETLKSPSLRKMFIEIHPHNVPLGKMQNFLKIIHQYGFDVVYAVAHDNYQRSLLCQTKIEKMSLLRLINDERVLKKKCAFEVFFKK